MERTDLGTIIEDAIAKFSQNRVGHKPRVFVTLIRDLTEVPWANRALTNFVRSLLYESLLTSDPDAVIEVTARRRLALDDLSAFLGLQPSYWLQLRLSGRGLRIVEPMVEELFSEVGYRREEWIGVESSNARLGIFDAIDAPAQKMVFCLESSHNVLRCDLLLPIVDPTLIPGLAADPENHRAAESSSKNDAAVIRS